MNDMSSKEMTTALLKMAQKNLELYADLIPSVSIPEGKRETAAITHFTVTAEEVSLINLSLLFDRQHDRVVAPGTYTRLTADGRLQMTDTGAEKMDHALVVKKATGDCLVTGLGLGMVANAMALKPEVKTVTVIEINADVIELVRASMHPKVSVIHADALEWKPGKGQKWDVIWHDIWPEISLDDCETRTALSRKFAQRWRVFHGAWAKDEIRRMQQGYY